MGGGVVHNRGVVRQGSKNKEANDVVVREDRGREKVEDEGGTSWRRREEMGKEEVLRFGNLKDGWGRGGG